MHVETVWPGISELRTTAFRTGNYAGMKAPEFGPITGETFKGERTYDDKRTGEVVKQEREVTVDFPLWCRITVMRELHGRLCEFVGPMVYWKEAYGRWSGTEVPNEMWANRPFG